MKACLALAVLSIAWVGCRSPPPPEDPGVRLYHDAVVLFAKLSDDTQDLSYRDARFDDVIALCTQVPSGSDLKPKADTLANRIRDGRAQAEALEHESAKLRAQAENAPAFLPEPRVEPTTPAPAPPAAANGVAAAPVRTATYVGSGNRIQAVARPFDPAHAAPLPDWYRQKGYFGLKPDGAAVPAAPAAPAAQAAVAEQPASNARPAPQRVAPASPDTPPPVFGLPGPAGHAIAPPPQ